MKALVYYAIKGAVHALAGAENYGIPVLVPEIVDSVLCHVLDGIPDPGWRIEFGSENWGVLDFGNGTKVISLPFVDITIPGKRK